MQKWFHLILILCSSMSSCSSEKQMVRTYEQRKDQFLRLTENCNSVFRKYPSTEIIVQYSSGVRQVRFAALLSSKKYVGYEFSDVDYSVLQQKFSDHLSPDERELWEKISGDSLVKNVIRGCMESKVRAINISQEGVFLALGSSLRKNSIDLSAGILVANNNSFDKSNVIREIEPGIFLYEKRVE